jgi:hypothetical protein
MASVSGAMAEEAKWADEEQVFDLSASEIGAALSWTRRAAEFNLGFAQDLLDRYPQVWEALDCGLIDMPRARVIVEQTRHLEHEVAGQICDLALAQASSQTTGQMRAGIRRLIIAIDPDSARKRYEQGVLERRVVSEANDSGTGNILGLDLPADGVSAVMRRINRLARAARSADDERTMDQIRADILLDLLGGRHQAGLTSSDRAVVDVRVDLETLLGLDDAPGEIPGWGPVIADVARRLVNEQDDARLRVTVTDPVSGEPIHIGVTRRRPDTTLKDRVEATQTSCAFPRCPMPSGQCDLDHRHDWSKGGATTDENLQPLCRYHHRLKHSGWKVRRTGSGVYLWQSPLGRTYTARPDPP